MTDTYVHGYELREAERLRDQADVLVELLHSDTNYPAGSTILEVGCGVGAQTLTLARRNPGSSIVAIDRSPSSIAEARLRVASAGLPNVALLEADLLTVMFGPESFDHLFVCFVLEHLADPAAALSRLLTFIKPGGTITVIEGDHGSTLVHPFSDDAFAVINCQVMLQAAAGGDARIGRQLYPLLVSAGVHEVNVSPRMIYADGSRPELADMFTRRTFTAMIEGIRESALRSELLTAERFDAGVHALKRAAEKNGVFCYTFFKATGSKPLVPSHI